jgi:hypothetical protein
VDGFEPSPSSIGCPLGFGLACELAPPCGAPLIDLLDSFGIRPVVPNRLT